ncbi:DHHC palmitoyltransferase-domain-containing protein [Spinellus fusiger]|nr:DHHC palmitoyltransferase-domain-containing protein [Spinellus fusiger]
MSSRLGAVSAGIILPLLALGILAYSWYVYVFRVCVALLIYNTTVQGAVFIAIASTLWLLCLLSYMRVLFTHPGHPNKENGSQMITTPFQLPEYYYSPSSDHCSPKTPSCHQAGYLFPIFSIAYGNGMPHYCDTCQCIKPERTHHCKECNTCVLKMDHHCPWVSGCVGHGNYKFFFLFVCYTCLYALWIVCTTAPLVADAIQQKGLELDPHWIVILIIGFLFGTVLCGFAFVHAHYILKNKTTIECLSTRLQEVRIDFDNSGSNFEVVSLHYKELLFNVGMFNNWKSVMGPTPFSWIIPLYRGEGDGHVFPYSPKVCEKLITLAGQQRMARLASPAPASIS